MLAMFKKISSTGSKVDGNYLDDLNGGVQTMDSCIPDRAFRG